MKKLLQLLVVLCLLQGCSSLQKTFINPFPIKPPGYTHVVVTDCARTIYISGQVPTNEKGEIVGKDDFAVQTRQVYENLKIALQAAGATFNDVVKMNTYIKNYTPDYLPTLRTIRADYLPKENPPASPLAGVQSLYHPDVLIEIEAIAVIEK
ncbi:MAG: RidA family protein [Saprospiraceae bacterium]